MAYTIGSQKGKDIASKMAIGSEYKNTTDGSKWYKNYDGTITVDHNGTRTNNAYMPEDYSILLDQQMKAGVPYEYVQNANNIRLNKALNDPDLYQYAYDGVYNDALAYINKGKAQEWVNNYEADNPMPEYNNKFDPLMMAKLNEILNRDDFSYDVANDPLYQQYANMYRREGDRAMKETMAEAAAGAGGMNTYAVTAAQQANSYYNSQLNDRIPELYQLAYDKYLKDIDLKVQDLGILSDMDSVYYNRYRDTMGEWREDKNFAYGAYYDAMQQGNWEKQFGYNDYWKQWDADNYKTEWDASRGDIAYERREQEKANAQNEIRSLIEGRVTTIPPALLEKAEWTQEQVDQMIAQKKTENSTVKPPGGPQYDTGNEDNGGTEPEIDVSGYGTYNNHGDDWIDLGGKIGKITWQELYHRMELGEVVANYDHENKKILYRQSIPLLDN